MQLKNWVNIGCVFLLLVLGISFVSAKDFISQESNPSQQAQEVTQPYEAIYDVARRGKVHGQASRILTQLDENLWHYETDTKARLFIFSDQRQHQTNFSILNGRVHPLKFEYKRTGTGKDKYFYAFFDDETMQLSDKDGQQLPVAWSTDLLDSNSVLHQLQIDLSQHSAQYDSAELAYVLIDEQGEIKDYEFEVLGFERLHLPYGVTEALKVMRVRETDRRETYFWFSPLHNFTLVQMQQLKEGKEEVKLTLRSLQFNDSSSSSAAYP